MQTMNEFVDSINVPTSLLPDLTYLKGVLKTAIDDNNATVYMCHCSVSDDFKHWMVAVIEENTPADYESFIERRGIMALFEHKKWMTVFSKYYNGSIDSAPTKSELSTANYLRLEFINLLIDKIKSKTTV